MRYGIYALYSILFTEFAHISRNAAELYSLQFEEENLLSDTLLSDCSCMMPE